MYGKISREEIKGLFDRNESFVLVNVLDSDDFEEERVCGSINIPVSNIENEAPKLINKDEKVVVHCSGPTCLASDMAARKLEGLGYKNVLRFEGGMQEWKKAGYCLEGRLHKKVA